MRMTTSSPVLFRTNKSICARLEYTKKRLTHQKTYSITIRLITLRVMSEPVGPNNLTGALPLMGHLPLLAIDTEAASGRGGHGTVAGPTDQLRRVVGGARAARPPGQR